MFLIVSSQLCKQLGICALQIQASRRFIQQSGCSWAFGEFDADVTYRQKSRVCFEVITSTVVICLTYSIGICSIESIVMMDVTNLSKIFWRVSLYGPKGNRDFDCAPMACNLE